MPPSRSEQRFDSSTAMLGHNSMQSTGETPTLPYRPTLLGVGRRRRCPTSSSDAATAAISDSRCMCSAKDLAKERRPRTQGLGTCFASWRGSSAILAVGFSVLLTTLIGVDALMTEEQCFDTALLGSVEGLAASPRADTSTEAVAVGIDGTVLASQTTYDRLVTDRLQISLIDGRDIPFRNLWSDRLWNGKVELTFSGAETLALFEEGTPPGFNCMNEHFGMTFVKGIAEKTIAYGTLKSEKVVNWSVLGEMYTYLDGLDAFDPHSESVVRSTTNLVAAQKEYVDNEIHADFHYFLSEPSSEVAEDCPEPCSGDIITYFWSTSPGAIYMLDKVSSDADPAPCWMPVFEEVADGPPASAITAWDADCIDALLQNVEEQQGNNAAAMDSSGSDAGSRSGEVAVTAAVTIPIILIVVVGAAFLLLRHQRRQRIKKMRTTDEAWGEGLDGMGKKKGPRPPTGKFKLGIAATPARPTGEAGRDEEEGVTPRTCSPPARTFTDISVDGDNDDDGEEEEVVVAGFGGFRREADEENTGADNMVYPL